MRKVWLAGIAVTLVLTGMAPLALAAEEENVCLVTFATTTGARQDNPLFVADASVMPRQYAERLITDYSHVFNYSNLETTVRACQCLANPAPANNIPQREATLMACPKPDRIQKP